jgi:L-ascorbate metabolism protein UlaG (beta-lactamase superfamily)
MISPFMQDDVFVNSVHSAQPGRLHLWWLGQSGFLIKWQDSHLLIDPYLSDSLTHKYAGTDKPHARMTARVVAPEQLNFVDVLTSSHNHTDHLDGETIIPLMQVNPKLTVIVPLANLDFAAKRLQVHPSRLTAIRTDTYPLSLGPFTFHAIPSAHERLEQDENGDHKFVGYVIEVGGRVIYHSGDACLYDGLLERLKRWKIDLAILPINGRDLARRVPGNFTAEEAAQLGRAIRAGKVIPCHYDMFEFNTVSPDEFTQHAIANGVDHIVLKNGEQYSL